MKIRNGKGKYAVRKAISPIIATVLIIAVTLIAAVAIGGFVFGIFGTASSSAQASVTGTALGATEFATTSSGTTTFTCLNATTTGDGTITVANTGTAAATVTGVTIKWAGASNSFTPSATCSIGAAGATGTISSTMYLNFPTTSQLTVAAATGQTYSGTVTLSNGASLLFTGTWQ